VRRVHHRLPIGREKDVADISQVETQFAKLQISGTMIPDVSARRGSGRHRGATRRQKSAA
jgi:hypothetical protein